MVLGIKEDEFKAFYIRGKQPSPRLVPLPAGRMQVAKAYLKNWEDTDGFELSFTARKLLPCLHEAKVTEETSAP